MQMSRSVTYTRDGDVGIVTPRQPARERPEPTRPAGAARRFHRGEPRRHARHRPHLHGADLHCRRGHHRVRQAAPAADSTNTWDGIYREVKRRPLYFVKERLVCTSIDRQT